MQLSKSTWDYEPFWNEMLNHISGTLSKQEYETWFGRMEYLRSSKTELHIGVPSTFFQNEVKSRYHKMLVETLYDLSGAKLTISFVVAKPKPTKQSPPREPVQSPQPQPRRRIINSLLQQKYTFENFVISENNKFAANAALAIALNPGKSYNPCLIYGGVGLGKTHLIQSIGNRIIETMDSLKVIYATTENFTNDFIQSVRENKTRQFKNKYRRVDVLLLDDIHFIQKKPETQEELFHTFNALFDANKQMIFTCDRPASELRNITDRLQNRFERGLSVDLQPPPYETRYAILKHKINQGSIHIPDEVTDLISQNVTTNIRDLEAALTKLWAYADLVHKEITLETAQKLLADMFNSPAKHTITISDIQRVVADHARLSVQDLKSKKRTKQIAFSRHIAMYITRTITELSTTEIGLEFGGRDHTTVMHSCQRIDTRLSIDKQLGNTIQLLINQIKQQSTHG